MVQAYADEELRKGVGRKVIFTLRIDSLQTRRL